ncbi:MAG: hypothetical protein KDI79_15330 [Anaerolineae bacterium]|nr:hypothetical protein [Anaerolineae bacterium]
MNINQLQKRLDLVESRAAQWAAADNLDRIRADIEAMSAPELDQLLINLFIAESGALWEQADHAGSYAAILQQMVDEDMTEFPNFPAEAWPPQLLEMFERHGVKIRN